jgi:hypothetical protein
MRGKLTRRQARELRRAVKEHHFSGGLIAWSIYKKLFVRGYVVGVKVTRANPQTGSLRTYFYNELTAKGRQALGLKP